MTEHRYDLGKIDYNGSGRRNCKAAITWELEGGRFTMSAEIWNPAETDCYVCGQCVDTVAAYFPHDARAQQMLAIWQAYHLNDMQAGSPAQRAFLEANGGDRPTYEKAVEFLNAAGLNPDPNYLHNGRPYRYGSAWLTLPLPTDVMAEIESWT